MYPCFPEALCQLNDRAEALAFRCALESRAELPKRVLSPPPGTPIFENPEWVEESAFFFF